MMDSSKIVEPSKVQLSRSGIVLNGVEIPLIAGTVHYWRMDPTSWKRSLQAVKGLGCKLIDVYIPWSVHEIQPGQFEFGQTDPQRNVVRFLQMAQELGLYAIVRPGPHINAEMTYFGIPKWVIWNPACQARSASNTPVMLPMLPFAFPVPSYASEVFFQLSKQFYKALCDQIVSLQYPEGPIVLVQVDNEGSLFFRDDILLIVLRVGHNLYFCLRCIVFLCQFFF